MRKKFFVGFGSLGSVVQGPIIGFLVHHTGWSGMLYFMTALSTLGSFVLIRATAVERREADAQKLIEVSDA